MSITLERAAELVSNAGLYTANGADLFYHFLSHFQIECDAEKRTLFTQMCGYEIAKDVSIIGTPTN